MLNKNSTWSLVGGVVPALAALISTPYMLSVLGFDLFSIASLILSVTIFFYVYDLGMSKTMTYLISRLPVEKGRDYFEIIASALVSTFFLSVAITLVLYLLVPFFVAHWMNINDSLLLEAKHAFQIALLGITPGLISNTLKGVLEGESRFKEANICKSFSGASVFIAPMLVIGFFNNNLIYISLAIVISRYLALALYVVYSMPRTIFSFFKVRYKYLGFIWNYGIWAAISGFISTTFVYGDRFIVAGYLSPQDLSIYVASQDVLIRYLLIPWSMAIVLLPTFSANNIVKAKIAELYNSQQKRVGFISFFVLLLAFIAAVSITSFTDTFAIPDDAKYVVGIQTVGIFFCALSQLPLIYLYGKGRPRLITKIFLLELLLYIIIAPLIFNHFGMIGACIVWSGRLVIEYFLLSYFAGRGIK